MGQFRTVWYKILCYNGRVKEDGSGLRMVLVYPLSMSFFHSTGFSLDAEQSVLHGMLVMPRRKSLVPCLRESTPESWRTMSHDAQVNTCYHINCQKRTRAHDAALHRRKPSTGSTSGWSDKTKSALAENRQRFFLTQNLKGGDLM